MRTVREQREMMLKDFVTQVQTSRGGAVGQDELAALVKWFDDILESLSATWLVSSGAAVIYWDEGKKEPIFTLTEKGISEATNEMKDLARNKNVFN